MHPFLACLDYDLTLGYDMRTELTMPITIGMPYGFKVLVRYNLKIKHCV